MIQEMKLYSDLAEYYFSIEDKHRDIDDDVTLIRSLLHNKQNPYLLDLGCGTGEHLGKLSKFGIKCVGLDSSASMLDIARKRFPHKIHFIKKDMKNIDYYNEFDIIISLFGSFNYLTNNAEIEKTLWNAWRALKPEGIAIFEIWNTIPVETIKNKSKSLISKTVYNNVTIDRERGFKFIPYPDKSIVEVDYTYTIKNGKGSTALIDKHIMRTFTIDEIKAFIDKNGFKVERIYSNFLKESYQEYSNRMIIHMIKE